MRNFLCLPATALAVMLAACTNTTVTDVLATADAADSAALAGVIAYEATPAAQTPSGKALIAKLAADQAAYDAAVAPIESAATSGGNTATAAQTEALNAALSLLESDMTAGGISPAAQ